METVSWKLVIDHSDALGRAGCASVVYKDRYVLIFGGRAKSLFFIDCLSLDTATGDLHPLNPHTTHTSGYNNSKISPRAHHSATIIGDTAWIIGGGNETELVEDAIACFYITNKKWTVPSMQGELHLLKRTAHGACIHPLKPSCILLFGGYTSCNDKDKGQWLQDLVLINTVRHHRSTIHTITILSYRHSSRTDFYDFGNYFFKIIMTFILGIATTHIYNLCRRHSTCHPFDQKALSPRHVLITPSLLCNPCVSLSLVVPHQRR